MGATRANGGVGDRRWTMRSDDLHRLVRALRSRFDEVIGPVVHDGVIRLRPIASAGELPLGVTDAQEAATYRLVPSGTPLHFSYGPGPDSLKSLVHPPRSPVWTMHRRDGSIVVAPATHPSTTRAVIGVRACDLRALAVLDRTQTGGPHADAAFAARRDALFVVAVDCTHPAPTCFCDTAGGGGTAEAGYDLSLTEFDDESQGPTYLVRCGSERGCELVAELALEPATEDQEQYVAAAFRSAVGPQHRSLPKDAAAVVSDAEHPHWSTVADRCLTCGNCTAVCPTCFCTDMDDRVSLDGASSTRDRVWDTCFSMEYSHLGAGPHRASPRSRYRQWLSHKLGTWHDQFGESGCVGCGRCITWCPVGIDLTAEVRALAGPVEAAP
ncbi:MAG: 4Fe-4S dicluster domain-containing protein [Ilumatobacteraceae bacterium]